MNAEALRQQWLAEERQVIVGWDFSSLAGRWQGEKLPWDYIEIVCANLRGSDMLLDMGTGGGEFLLTLAHPYMRTSVTESWPPNVALCRERLEPLGVTVRQIDADSAIPYENASFDIVINRHESYDVNEVRRILKPGGLFITQQVGGRNCNDLSARLIPDFRPLFPAHDLTHCRAALEAARFSVLDAREHVSPLRFFDVGAVVFYAKIIEWEFPGFSVDRCLEQLLRLEREIEKKGEIVSMEHRFLLVAVAPA